MQFLAGILTGVFAAFIYYSGIWQDFQHELQPLPAQQAEVIPEEPVMEKPVIEEAVLEQTVFEPTVEPEPAPQLETVSIAEPEVSEIAVDEAPVVQVEGEFQTVWLPFRSEASATGFAEKLSHQLGREFQVEKRRPGHYEVGFMALNQSDRNTILEHVEAITGFHPAS